MGHSAGQMGHLKSTKLSNWAPFSDHLHRPQPLIPPPSPHRMMDLPPRAKAAILSEGSAPSTPAVADASTQVELLKRQDAPEAFTAGIAWTFLLWHEKAADLLRWRSYSWTTIEKVRSNLRVSRRITGPWEWW